VETRKTGGELDSIRVSLASVEDTRAIGAVKRRVWPQEAVEDDLIQEALTHRTHAVLAVWCDESLVGFVDGFLTRSVAGVPRWEVDLLAVHPDHQGRGLGTRLVSASLKAGAEKGARLARGLVRLDNFASQRVFERCGFSPRPRQFELYVSTGVDGSCPRMPPEGYWVEVQTFGYRGLWLEERFTQTSLESAVCACRSRNLDLAGALIPAEDGDALQTARRLGYSRVGDYQWWVKELV